MHLTVRFVDDFFSFGFGKVNISFEFISSFSDELISSKEKEATTKRNEIDEVGAPLITNYHIHPTVLVRHAEHSI